MSFKSGVKGRGSDRWWERRWWLWLGDMRRMRWTRRTVNTMRLTEWRRELIPQVRWCISKIKYINTWRQKRTRCSVGWLCIAWVTQVSQVKWLSVSRHTDQRRLRLFPPAAYVIQARQRRPRQVGRPLTSHAWFTAGTADRLQHRPALRWPSRRLSTHQADN